MMPLQPMSCRVRSSIMHSLHSSVLVGSQVVLYRYYVRTGFSITCIYLNRASVNLSQWMLPHPLTEDVQHVRKARREV